MDQEVLDARAKLAARFGKTQVGGKGMFQVWSVHPLKFSELEIYECYGLVLFSYFAHIEVDIVFLNCRNPKKNQEGCSSYRSQRGQKTQINH